MGMARVTFKTTVLSGGRTATGIRVPDDVVASLGGGKRPPVQVTVNGYAYRSTVGVMGGAFMIPLSAEHRTAAGLAAGDDIDVVLEPDTAPREVVVPDDFAAALAAEPDARRFFDGLSYSNKRRFVLSIDGAKTPATRQRRIDKSVTSLREGRV